MTSAATCPEIIRTATQFAACVPLAVAQQFWPRAQAQKGAGWVISMKAAINGGYGTLQSAYVWQLVPVVQTSSGVTQISSTGAVTQAGATYQEATPNSLAQANWWYATELTSEAPESFVRDLATRFQVRQDVAPVEMRAGVALVMAGMASKVDRLIPDLIEDARAQQGAAGSFWSKFSSGFNRLFSDPIGWMERVFLTEPGKAVQWAGRQMVAASKTTWGRWLIDPLGIVRVIGTFLDEIGGTMISGSISDFDERKFMLVTAQHWRDMGAALAVAALFLPPPWNVVAYGLAALFTFAGVGVQMLYAQAEAERQAAAFAASKAAAAAVARENLRDAEAEAAYQAELAGAAVLGPENPSKGLDWRAVVVLGLAGIATLWATSGK